MPNVNLLQVSNLRKTYKFSEIPTKNRISVIDNYSKNYNYIVEGDKIYYSNKNKKDDWIDISDNDMVRKNLLNFLGDKYNFVGYDDGEDKIRDQVNAGTYKYNAKSNPTSQSIAEKPKFNIFKFLDIPTKNRLSVIDNYDKNYNYVIEGDKLYFSLKGRDHWVDISDLPDKKKALYKFINDKYNWVGYDDKEKEIYNLMINPTETEVLENNKEVKQVKPKQKLISKQIKLKKPILNLNYYANPYVTTLNPEIGFYLGNQLRKKVSAAGDWIEDKWNDAKGALTILLERGFSGLMDAADNKKARQDLLKQGDLVTAKGALSNVSNDDSEYAIRPGTFTANDSILDPGSGKINWHGRKLIVKSYTNANEEKFGIRNHGDYNQISNTNGVALPVLFPFKPYGQHDTNHGLNYIGIDKDGNIKLGDINQFGPGDMLSNTTANDIYGFKHDADGQVTLKIGKTNQDRFFPVTLVKGGTQPEGSLNILSGARAVPDKDNFWRGTYGSAAGGTLCVKAGNEIGFITGSISDLDRQIEELKKRNNVDYVTVFNGDNGSFSTGLRTYDRNLTSLDLKTYDSQNGGVSGSFLYFKGPKENTFRSDTIYTSNVRTKESDSYKSGHPLINEKKGVVLHHTAFTDEDTKNALNHMLNPQSEAAAHVLIGYNGNRTVMAKPDQVTFHAGQSYWNGRDNVNDFMLGIEFLGDTNKKDLTEQQLKSAIEYLKPIVRLYNIPIENIITHELIRDAYNDYARKSGKAQAPSKPDINQRNYAIILKRLLLELYYKKKNGGRLKLIARQ